MRGRPVTVLEPQRIVRLEADAVVVLDQRLLPHEVVEVRCASSAEVAEAIRTLAVRGAPAIGVAAAYGLALAAAIGEDLDAAYAVLAGSRPTAVNLRWALDELRDDPTPERARRLHEDEVARCRQMGANAVELFAAGSRILTHCNAGGLATGGYGTALGAVRAAWERGLVEHVWVDETRPLLQGARLTAWELETLGIPHSVIVDSAAGSLMSGGDVDIVVTGADRIAANGDTANKIGTYALAVLARHHGLPFVVVAPTSTLDAASATGADIPIEEREPAEVTARFAARNPAFDVTPAALIDADRDRAGRPPGAVRGHAAAARARPPMILDELDSGTRALLERFGFDAERFRELQRRVAAGELSPATNVVSGVVEPPLPSDLTRLPDPGEPGYEAAREAGAAALRAGEVAQVVLTGGMATRFGGVVKGVVEAVDGRSFLELKLAETAELARAVDTEIPVALMTSFATDEVVRAHVADRGLGDPLVFHQFVSLRLGADGELFRDYNGRASPYAPGHGDLFEALRGSGTLATLRERGVRVVTVSNVDNLGARVDPAVLGAHLLAGRPMTAEVARKEGDLGGAPVRIDGRLQLLEAPRFPAAFDRDLVPVFNTNTALFELEALDRDAQLTWLFVEKDTNGRPAVQLERVYHEISRDLETTYLEVPRRGPLGRFFPIKTPEDLRRSQDDLRVMLAASPS